MYAVFATSLLFVFVGLGTVVTPEKFVVPKMEFVPILDDVLMLPQLNLPLSGLYVSWTLSNNEDGPAIENQVVSRLENVIGNSRLSKF
jgi:hypothetical protein